MSKMRQTLTEWMRFVGSSADLVKDYCADHELDPDTFYLSEWEDDQKAGVALWKFVSPLYDFKLEVGLLTRPREFLKPTDVDHICMI